MAVRFSTTGLIVGGAYPAPYWLSFLDAVLRGMSQIMLQNNSYAGLVFSASTAL
jgi:urea transporter